MRRNELNELDDEIEEALYAGASSTMKTAQYGERSPTTPSDTQIAKFKTQVKRFLEALPDETTVLELREFL